MIGLIWAQSRNGAIGADGGIPWDVPEDRNLFRAVTLGSTVVMGRRTWESLRGPLDDRTNVVVTAGPAIPGVTCCLNLADALATIDPDQDVWIIGGERLYREGMRYADLLAVTEVDIDVPGDTFAPEIGAEWETVEMPWMTSQTGLRYRTHTYMRRSNE